MGESSKRAGWLPWLAAALAVAVVCLAYQRFRLKLLVDDFLYRDRNQQAELDHVQSLLTASEAENARLKAAASHPPASTGANANKSGITIEKNGAAPAPEVPVSGTGG